MGFLSTTANVYLSSGFYDTLQQNTFCPFPPIPIGPKCSHLSKPASQRIPYQQSLESSVWLHGQAFLRPMVSTHFFSRPALTERWVYLSTRPFKGRDRVSRL